MSWSAKPTSTFGQARTAFGAAPAAGAGGFQRAAGFGGGAAAAPSFGGTQSRFGATAAPGGFGARTTTGFGATGGGAGATTGGFGAQAATAGGFGAGGAAQQGQQGQGNPAVPNWRATEAAEPDHRTSVQAICAMDFYSQYSFEQLRWLNMTDPSTIPVMQATTTTGFGAAAGGFGQRNAAAPAAAGGFGATATGFGAKQTGFGATGATTGFGAKQTGAAGGFGATATGFGAKPTGFGATAAPAKTGFGATAAGGFGSTAAAGGGGFGSTAAPAASGFGARPSGFGAATGAAQPVFSQQGAAVGGFGAKPAGTAGFSSFGNSALRTAQGVPRDASTGATTGFGARPATGFGAAPSAYGQQQAAVGGGFGQTAGGFARPAYAAAPQAEPVYYTTIATSPFGVLPNLLKEPATPKQAAEAHKTTSISSGQQTTSASKRRQAMLPHYKLTPRSELSGGVGGGMNARGVQGGVSGGSGGYSNSFPTPGGSMDAEAAGRDMFVSKIGGVKKLTIEATDSETSALFNANERARVRSGTTPMSSNQGHKPPGTPGGMGTSPYSTYGGGGVSSQASPFTSSPSVAATPSFPRPGSLDPIYPSFSTQEGSSSSSSATTSSSRYAGGPSVAILTSPSGSLGSSITSPSYSAISPVAPKLTIPGCYTIPSLSDLQRKSPNELARLPEFTIGHARFGSVTWKSSATDVRNLNLDELVSFQQDSVEVYPESNFPHGSPADGVLNKTAIVTIFNVSVYVVLARVTGDERMATLTPSKRPLSESHIDLITAELRRLTSSFNGRFISFVTDGNKWTFEVDHFTRYGLSGSNAVVPPSSSIPPPSSSSHHPKESDHQASRSARDRDGAPAGNLPSGPPFNPLFVSRTHRVGTIPTSASGLRRSSRSPAKLGIEGPIDDDHELQYDEQDAMSDDISSDHPLVLPLLSAKSSRSTTASSMDYESQKTGSMSKERTQESEDEASEEDILEFDARSHSRSSLHHSSGEYDSEDSYDQDEEEETNEEGERRGEASSDFSYSDSIATRSRGARRPSSYRMEEDENEGEEALASAEGRRSGREARRGGAFESQVHSSSHSHPSHPLPLAKQLGLDARTLHTMQAHLFPSGASKFETTRREEMEESRHDSFASFDPSATLPPAKRFKSSREALTEVKLHAPLIAQHQRRARESEGRSAQWPLLHSSSPSRPLAPSLDSAPSSSLLSLPSVPFEQVPFQNSVTRGATEATVDARLWHSRSFRVAWAPDGSLFCPSFTSITRTRVFVAPSSVAAALTPSLEAHKLLSISTHAKHAHALPSISLSDHWNEFVKKQVVIAQSQREEMSHALLAFQSPHLPSSMHKRLDLQAQQAIGEAYMKFETEWSTWKLVETLYGAMEKVKRTEDAFDGSPAHAHVSSLLRKHLLDAFLCESVLEDVKRDLKALVDEQDDSARQWKVLFTLLTGKRIKEAVTLAMSMKEHRLALMLTQAADPTELHKNIALQLHTWTREGVLAQKNACEPYKLQVLSILAGSVRVVASEAKMKDWLRAFALFFWYSGPNAFATPLERTIEKYVSLALGRGEEGGDEKSEMVVEVSKAAGRDGDDDKSTTTHSSVLSLARPFPSYSRSFLPLSPSSSHYFDVRFHLLRLYADRTYAVQEICHPLCSTSRILDFSLPWHLFTVLQAAGLGIGPMRSSELAVGFASQLEMSGAWNWAIYVLLSLPAARSTVLEYERNEAVKAILMRNARALEKAVEEGEEEVKVDEQKLAAILLNLDIPLVWVYASLAQWYRYQGKWKLEVVMRMKAEQYEEAHNLLLNKWAPLIVLQYGIDASVWPLSFIEALNLLESEANKQPGDDEDDDGEEGRMQVGAHPHTEQSLPFSPSSPLSSLKTRIPNWTYGGNIYASYRRWFCAIKDATLSWQSSAASLVDLPLLAQLNRDSSHFLTLVNDWTAALHDLHSHVVALEQGAMRHSAPAVASTNGSVAPTNASLAPTNAYSLAPSSLPALLSPAAFALRLRSDLHSAALAQELVASSQLVSQLILSISSLKLLISCIDSDAPLPARISAHLVPLSSYETLDSLEPLADSLLLPPDQLSSNLALLTSRYLDWRVSAL